MYKKHRYALCPAFAYSQCGNAASTSEAGYNGIDKTVALPTRPPSQPAQNMHALLTYRMGALPNAIDLTQDGIRIKSLARQQCLARPRVLSCMSETIFRPSCDQRQPDNGLKPSANSSPKYRPVSERLACYPMLQRRSTGTIRA